MPKQDYATTGMERLRSALRGFTPGSREWYADQIYGTGVPADVEQKRAESADFIASMTPVIGEGMALRDAWDASGRGGQALMQGDIGGAAGEYMDLLSSLAGGLLPFSVQKLTSAAMPASPRSTTFTGAGPTDKPISAAEFDRLWAEQVQSPAGTASTVDTTAYLNPSSQYLEELSPLPKRSIRGPSGGPNRPRKETEVQVYHGTTSADDFPKFDPDNFASSSTSGKVYLTDHPTIGSYYADPDIMKKLEDPNYRDWERPRVMPSYLDTEGFAVIDAGGKPIDDVEHFDDLIKQGYKGVVIKNVLDVSGPNKGGKRPFAVQNQYVTWTPGTLRSSISEQQLYNAAPYIAAPAISYGVYGARDDEQ